MQLYLQCESARIITRIRFELYKSVFTMNDVVQIKQEEVEYAVQLFCSCARTDVSVRGFEL